MLQQRQIWCHGSKHHEFGSDFQTRDQDAKLLADFIFCPKGDMYGHTQALPRADCTLYYPH
jgi:hypothetical protein